MSMNLNMRTSEVGVALIKRAEGFSPRLYLDEGRQCIGYGCDLTDEEARQYDGVAITADQGESLLRARLPYFEELLSKNTAVPLTQNQFDASIDAIYNIGPGRAGVKDGLIQLKNGQPSTFLRVLNQGDYSGAATALLAWDYAGGKVNAGLEARRKEEQKLFLTPDTVAG